MIYAGGVDVGSTQTKAIVLSEQRKIIGRALINTGAMVSQAAERAFREAAADAGVAADGAAYVVGTGYGRYKVTFGNAQITEISCHARGANFLFPKTRTVIDMGGQDAKGIRVGRRRRRKGLRDERQVRGRHGALSVQRRGNRGPHAG